MTLINAPFTLIRIEYTTTTNLRIRIDGRDSSSNDGTAGDVNKYRFKTGMIGANDQILNWVRLGADTHNTNLTPNNQDEVATENYVISALDLMVPMSALDGYFASGWRSAAAVERSWDILAPGGVEKLDKVDMTPLTNWTSTVQTLIDPNLAVGDVFYLILWQPSVTLETLAGMAPGTPLPPKYRFSGGCLQYTFDNGTTWHNLACSLATLQDALNVLAEAYPVEKYVAGIDNQGFIRVQSTTTGNPGQITFSQTFQETLNTFLVDFWPPELWYEHIPKWL